MFGMKRHAGTVLVADVDEASVGVSLVRLDAKAEIIQSFRVNLPAEKRSPDHSVSAITQLLGETVEKAVQVHAADPKATPLAGSYIIVHAPWTRFRTSQAEEMYAEPVAVTENLIASLTKKALENPSELDPAHRLESGVVHVYVNGYPTNNPVGNQATRIAVTAYESDISPNVQQTLTEVLAKALPGRTPVVRSSMCALLGVVSEHVPEIHRNLIIDVGSSSTYCAVVQKDAVMQTTSVPEGLATILSRIAGGALPEEVMTQLRMLASDTCATEACKALKDSLARLEPDLAKNFGEAFAKLAAERRLPNTAMLSAPGEVAPWMAGFFSRIDFAQFTATMQPFSVELLTADHLADAVGWENHTADTGLGIAAAYVHMLVKNI